MQKLLSLDRVANILTVVAAVTLIVFLAHRFFSAFDSVSTLPPIGSKISIEGFSPGSAKNNVLIAMIKGCRYCEDSMPFYRNLGAKFATDHTTLYAVFPPDTKDADSYISSYGLNHVTLLYTRLSSIGVSGTPTVILTNSSGTVVKVWEGRLSATHEHELIETLASLNNGGEN